MAGETDTSKEMKVPEKAKESSWAKQSHRNRAMISGFQRDLPSTLSEHQERPAHWEVSGMPQEFNDLRTKFMQKFDEFRENERTLVELQGGSFNTANDVRKDVLVSASKVLEQIGVVKKTFQKKGAGKEYRKLLADADKAFTSFDARAKMVRDYIDMKPFFESQALKKATATEAKRTENPWLSDETSEKEVLDKMEPMDWKEFTKDIQFVALGDDHTNTAIRRYVYENAEAFKAAGFTHIGVEAFSKDKAELDEKTDFSDVDIRPGTHMMIQDEFAGREGYIRVIQEMASKGIKPVAIDVDPTIKDLDEKRESGLTQNAMRIFQDNPGRVKMLVLLGKNHTSRKEFLPPPLPPGLKLPPEMEALLASQTTRVPFVKRMIDANYSTLTVAFTGGENITHLSAITNASEQAGLHETSFSVDMRSYDKYSGLPEEKVRPDRIIHLKHSMTLAQHQQIRLREMIAGAIENALKYPNIKVAPARLDYYKKLSLSTVQELIPPEHRDKFIIPPEYHDKKDG